MSKLCIGAIRIKNCYHTSLLKSHIKALANKYGYGVFYDILNCEPFMDKYLKNEYMFFSIADDDSFDNCEMLLLPDGCLFNGETNPVSFLERMKNIQIVLENILAKENDFELYIGNSGTDYYDYERIKIDVKEFNEIANKKLNTFDISDICFILTNITGDG